MPLPWLAVPQKERPRGRFLVPGSLPARLPYVEPARRRLRVRFDSTWLADSERAVLLHEPERRPVVYFPAADVRVECLDFRSVVTSHVDLGKTAWYAVNTGDRTYERAAFHHIEPPAHATDFSQMIGFCVRAIDEFCEEGECIAAGAPDPYRRVDVRRTSRRLVVKVGGTVVVASSRPAVVYETGCLPRWCVPRADVEPSILVESAPHEDGTPGDDLSYFDVAGVQRAARLWKAPSPEPGDLVGFDPGLIEIELDGVLVPAPQPRR
ncbi:DUF427 domain-containing protein [Amycolatopsis sp. NPDC051903]|uniref:DUF427 domain-containing protein n=1 Tax=Amycolatopsis sp. NPDC051903 TaxID=3363936 RepID=UPI0037B21841